MPSRSIEPRKRGLSYKSDNADKMKAIMASGKSESYKFTYKPQMKKVTKAKGKLAQRRIEIERLAIRANELNQETEQTIESLSNKGYEVENEDLIRITKNRIDEIVNKEKPTQKDLEKMREYASRTMYDYIKVKMKVPDKEVDGIQVNEEKWLPLKEVRLSVLHQLKNPYGLTEKETEIISQYAQALIGDLSSRQLNLQDKQEAENFKKRFKADRSVIIGGESTLINDLSYTYGAWRLGTEFVIKMQGIMSDPNNFVMIESWYNSKKGEEVKKTIEASTKKYWYEGFLSFSVAIITAISSMPNLNRNADTQLSDFQSVMEIAADEEMY